MRPFLSALVLSSVISPILAQQPAAYLSDPKFQKELAAAKEPHQRLPDQVGHWKKLAKLSNGACVSCLEQVALLDLRTGELKESISYAKMMEQAATKPTDKAYADFSRAASTCA